MIRRWFPALALCLAAFGCSEKTDKPTGSAPAPKAQAITQSAPASPALQKALVGVWVLDVEALERDPELAKLDAKAKAEAVKVAAELMKGTQIRFDADGALSMQFGASRQTGTWRITGAKGDTLTIETRTKGAKGPRDEQISARLQGDALRITGTDGRSLDLKRQLSAP